MASTFDTKFEAALDKVAQSAKARPWKRPLFWVAAAAFVLFAILKETLEGLFEATENLKEDDRFNFNPTENDIDEFGQTAAERLNNRNILFETIERTDDFGTVQDGDW